MKIFLAIPLLVSMSLLNSCRFSEDITYDGGLKVPLTPRNVEDALGLLHQDLGRVLAVTEGLENDRDAQATRVLRDDSFQELVYRHAAGIGRITAEVNAMTPDARTNFVAKIKPSVRALELRMEAICACGPSAQDAFAPVFVTIQDNLRSTL